MQFEITDEAAIAFAGRLYDALARGFPVDAALAQARRSIFAAGNDIEFGTPVLFLRGRDARLFDVISDTPTSAPLPVELEEPKPLSSLDVGITPTYRPWLPRPWQEWWFAFKADMPRTLARIPSRALARIPTRSLVVGCVLLLLAGTVVTTASGQKTTGGNHQSTLGAVLVDVGFFGLLAIAIKAAYVTFQTHLERLRNWWNGNG